MSSPLGENQLIGASGQATGYEIDYSCRFDDDADAYIYRTPGSTGNRRTYTFSMWLKLGNPKSEQYIFAVGGNNEDGLEVSHGAAGFQWRFANTNGGVIRFRGNNRDPAAWQHIVLAVDTTQGTNTNRVKFYHNGIQQSATGSPQWPSQNYDSAVNTQVAHRIANNTETQQDGFFFDGLVSEVHFIDGQALTAASFGETDEDYSHWKPIKYAGTYGTNGYFLEFKDIGSGGSNLGIDTSGNGNNWTTTGVDTGDQMVDTPTNNFCTMNPVHFAYDNTNSGGQISEGNTEFLSGGHGWQSTMGTLLLPASGKWYYEVCNGQGGLKGVAGFMEYGVRSTTGAPLDSSGINSGGWYGLNGQDRKNGSTVNTWSNWNADGDVVPVSYTHLTLPTNREV